MKNHGKKQIEDWGILFGKIYHNYSNIPLPSLNNMRNKQILD